VVKNLDVNNLGLIGQVILGNLFLSVMGLVWGYIDGLIFRSSSNEKSFICAILSSAHTTSIPLIIINVLGPVLDLIPYDQAGGKDAIQRGLLYISMNAIYSTIWRWGVCYNMINPDKKEKVDAEEHLIEKKDGKEKPEEKSWKEIILEMLNTPLIVCFIAILICLSVTIRDLFIVPGAFLNRTFMSVHSMMGKSLSFLSIFLLGLNFSNILFAPTPSNNPYQRKTSMEYLEGWGAWKISATTFTKLIIMPAIGSPILFLMYNGGIITDPVELFLFLFMLTAPNAISLIVVCNAKKTRTALIAVIMIIQYGVSIITLTFANALYLYLLIPSQTSSTAQ
jgi:predicted permease